MRIALVLLAEKLAVGDAQAPPGVLPGIKSSRNHGFFMINLEIASGSGGPARRSPRPRAIPCACAAW